MTATGRRSPKSARLVRGTISVVVLLTIWQLLFSTRIVETDFFAAPWDALLSGIESIRNGKLLANFWPSAYEFIIGFVVATVLGIVLGFAMALFPLVDKLLGPSIWALYALPRIAFIPLLIVWFGIGLSSKVVMVFLGVIFPVIINTALGARSVDETTWRVMRSYSATRFEALRYVLLPTSVPYVIDGCRLGAGRGVIGVILAEMFASSVGLGRLLINASQALDMGLLVFLLLLIALLGLAISETLHYIGKRLGGWRDE